MRRLSLIKARQEQGFTLIEVLVALVILAISLTAIIKATNDNISNMTYLQNKMLTHWIAMNIIADYQRGIRAIPINRHMVQDKELLDQQKWYWNTNFATTPDPYVLNIQVDVYQDAEKSIKLAHLESYLGIIPAVQN